MTSFLLRAICALALLSLLTTQTTAARSSRLFQRAPLPPTEDPFYHPPIGFRKKTPGTILRHRLVPGAILPMGNTTANIKTAYEILYRTTNALGHPQATVTTLLVPNNADPAKLMSYQTAEDSAWRNCAPSAGLQQSFEFNPLYGEIAIIGAALYRGWYVSVPDYEGPKSAFTAGPQAAYATLDNIRAVLNSCAFSGLSDTARTVMTGYSGGGLASEWAAEFQPSYAPDLNIVGMAAGGLTPNVSSVLFSVNEGPFAALIATGFNGLAAAYPNMSRLINKHLIPETAAEFYTPLSACLDEVGPIFAGKDIFSYFDNGIAILTDVVTQSIINIAGIMGLRGPPSAPLFFYKAIADEQSPVADTDALYNKYCSKGVPVTYRRNTFGEHVSEFLFGASFAFAWMKDRLEGVEMADECSMVNTTVNTLDPGIAALMGQATYDYLELLLAYL